MTHPGPVTLPQQLLDTVCAEARAAVPLECCGLLLGRGTGVIAAHRARNTLASPSRYRVDPADHFAAIRRARGMGLTVIGAYHSHPKTPPIASARDTAEASGEGFLHLIVQATSYDYRLYRVAQGSLHSVAVRVTTGLISVGGGETTRPVSEWPYAQFRRHPPRASGSAAPHTARRTQTCADGRTGAGSR